MPPKALITGATGFIGSHLAEALAARQWEILCLVRPSSNTHHLEKLPVQILRGDTSNLEFLERAVEKQDYVFHLAGRIRPAPREVYDKANHQLTRNLVLACLRKNPNLKRFLYVSSISAAGPSPPGRFIDEKQPPSPTSEYGRTKLKGEEAVRESWDRILSTIIRPPNVYGPRQKDTEQLIKLIQKRAVPLLKSTEPMTSVIYVEDLIEGILQAALTPQTQKQLYYLTDGKGQSWRNLILIMKKYILGNGLFFPIPENLIRFLAWFADGLKSARLVKTYFGRKVWRAMTQTPWLFSSAKAQKDFGFWAHHTVEEGLQKTVAYCTKRKRSFLR